MPPPFRKVWARGVHPLLWDLGPEVPLGVVDCNPPLFMRHACHTIGEKVHYHHGFCLNEWFFIISVMSRVTRRGFQGWRVKPLLCSVRH